MQNCFMLKKLSTAELKGLAQAKIIKKSVILFWFPNMTRYRDEIPVFPIFDMVVNN